MASSHHYTSLFYTILDLGIFDEDKGEFNENLIVESKKRIEYHISRYMHDICIDVE